MMMGILRYVVCFYQEELVFTGIVEKTIEVNQSPPEVFKLICQSPEKESEKRGRGRHHFDYPHCISSNPVVSEN